MKKLSIFLISIIFFLQTSLLAYSSDPKEFISSISIIKNYERIGDYAIKLSKIMHYIAKGEDYSSE